MSFFGSTFVFDDIPSETFNLYISSPDGGEVDVPAGSDVELLTETIFRRPVPYLYGVQQTPVLEFDISINSPNEIYAEDAQIIQSWLFGNMQYKKLQIMQEDMQDVYFNCFLTNPQANKTGNLIRGFKCTVVCDAPWAWTFTRDYIYNYSSWPVNQTLVFNNESGNNYYTFPEVAFTMDDITGGTFFIRNDSDASRIMLFEGLSPSEAIIMNSDLQILTSSTGLRRLSNFNKNWFRLLKGYNTLFIGGYIKYLKISYSEARKMGG